MPEPSRPLKTTSLVAPLMLRADLTREQATDYWANSHAEIVKHTLPGLSEYVQRHFSPNDHSFWPGTGAVGTRVPDTWRFDGYAELRFQNLRKMLVAPLHQRAVFFDEQNAFARVLGHTTMPGGGRWWTTGHDETVGHRATLLLRRRRGVDRRTFQRFVYERLALALLEAGASDTRAYVFMPWTRLVNMTAGVAHNNPIEHRFHALVTFGLEDRAALDALLASAPIAGVVAEQHEVLTALHAYSIERSVPVISSTA